MILNSTKPRSYSCRRHDMAAALLPLILMALANVHQVIAQNNETGTVLCPGLKASDYCDCTEIDCTESLYAPLCACEEAQKCCAPYRHDHDHSQAAANGLASAFFGFVVALATVVAMAY